MEVVAPTAQEMCALVESVTGGDCLQTDLLAGQASTRRYFRVHTSGTPARVVVMVVPNEDRAVEPVNYPFLNVHAYLEAHHCPVPKVLRPALAQGLIVLEDLGDETLEAAASAYGLHTPETVSLYKRAIGLIAQLQSLPAHSECVAFDRKFDFKLLRWELDHFRQWLLEEGRGINLGPPEAKVVEESFDRLAGQLAEVPLALAHRDFQSRNIMVDPSKQLRLIDFQDALLACRVYDLVALLRDSYVSLDDVQVVDLINFFASVTSQDLDATKRLFHLQTVQRKLKDAGRFVFIDRQRGNPAFLPCIPLSLKYVGQAFANLPDYADVWAVLSRHLPELRV